MSDIKELEKRVFFAWDTLQTAKKAVEDAEERLQIEQTKLILASQELRWALSEWDDEWELWGSHFTDAKIANVMKTADGKWRADFTRFPHKHLPCKSGFFNLEAAQSWVMEQLKPYLPNSESEPSEP